MEDSDMKKWQEAMKLEMEFMYSISVWELVDLPKGVEPIGCTQIFKRKRGADRKGKTYKVRVVAKGYSQMKEFIMRNFLAGGQCLNPSRYSYPLQHVYIYAK